MKEEQSKEILEFLKRAEIRTMTKDIATVREEEAKKERERIAALRSAHEQTPNLSPVNAFQRPAPLPPAVPLPKTISLAKPPSRVQKIIVRTLVGGVALLLLLNISLFIYWYFTQRIL